MICLGGAMAEELLLGERSTGAASDFEEAIRMAKQIISSGISHLGVVCLESISQENLNQAIKVIINFQEQLVRQLIMSFQDCTRIIARLLVENETVPGEQLRQYLSWQNRLGA